MLFKVLLFFLLISRAVYADFTTYHYENELAVIRFEERMKVKAQGYHYVFAPGVLSHFVNWDRYLPRFSQTWPIKSCLDAIDPNFFREMRQVISEDLGSSSSIYYRSFGASVAQSAEDLAVFLEEKYMELNQTYSTSTPKKKLVLVGHSKGGVEALLSILTHPNLILKDQIVDHVVILQSPIMGTIGIPENLDDSYLIRACNAGLEHVAELNPKKIKEMWRGILEKIRVDLTETERQVLNEKIFYLGSLISQSEELPILSDLAQFASGQNLYNNDGHDGLIRLRDQILALNQDEQPIDQLTPDLGTFVGLVPAGHCSLVVGGYLPLIKKSHLNPYSFLTKLPAEYAEKQRFRTQFAKIFFSYFLK